MRLTNRDMQRKPYLGHWWQVVTRIYSKEYGWERASLVRWLRWNLLEFRKETHAWYDLGDPCYCGSDNCAKCRVCGIESHD